MEKLLRSNGKIRFLLKHGNTFIMKTGICRLKGRVGTFTFLNFQNKQNELIKEFETPLQHKMQSKYYILLSWFL